jgi:cobalt-zinc-cadmium efflux system outer membrane protein
MSKMLLRIVCMTGAALLAGTWAAPGYAQQANVLSIDALANIIIANNPERRFYAQQIGLAGAERDASDRLPDPEVAFEFGERRMADGLTGAPRGAGPTYGVSIMQPLDLAGRGALRRAIADRQIALARIGLAQFDAALTSRARSLGYALFAAEQKAVAARDVAVRMRALARIVEQRDPAGVASALDAAILDASAITAERNAALADSEASTISYELNQLRGVSLKTRIRIAPPVVTLPGLPSAERMAQQAGANNFEIRALRAQLQQQGLRVDLAQTARIPNVSVGPYVNHARSDSRETNFGVRLTTTLPIWNSQAAGVAQELSRQSQGEAAVITANRRVTRQVYEQAAYYETKRRVLATWPAAATEKFASAATIADNSYRQGAIPVATYVEMQRQYLDALSALLDTRREAMEAMLQLRALNGGRSFQGVSQ